MTRPNVNKNKKKTYRQVDFAISSEHLVKTKESEKI